ncbi:unnamed protein product, partial [Symbiodinium sp. KB8]
FKTPQFWATVVASSIFRFCAAPSIRLEVHHINWVILLVNMLCLTIGFGVPRQLFPVLAVGRVSIGVFSPDPWPKTQGIPAGKPAEAGLRFSAE